MWFVYILECEDKSLYVGLTGNVRARVERHLIGIGSRFTASKGATKLLYKEAFDQRSRAEARERQIKRWSRNKKMALVLGDLRTLKDLSKSRD